MEASTRFGARVVASAGTIAQMQGSVATRPLLWDKLYQGIPPSPVTAVTVPDNRFVLEGHDLVIVEVGDPRSWLPPGGSHQQSRQPRGTRPGAAGQ